MRPLVNLLTAFLLAAAGACGSSAPSATIDEQSNGANVPLSVGEGLTVVLRSLGDSGFPNWTITTSPDHAVLKSIAAEHQPPSSGRPGDFGKDVFTFQAVAAGQTSLTASTTQPWPAGDTASFAVNVQVR